MPDEVGKPHIHGTPIVDEPQTVRELFQWAYAKFAALEGKDNISEDQGTALPPRKPPSMRVLIPASLKPALPPRVPPARKVK